MNPPETSELGILECIGLLLNQLFLASINGKLGVFSERVRCLNGALPSSTKLTATHQSHYLTNLLLQILPPRITRYFSILEITKSKDTLLQTSRHNELQAIRNLKWCCHPQYL